MNRMKELRLEKNLKQSDLAEIFGCSQQMISKYEQNRTNLNGMIEEIAANYFDCSVDYLKGLTDIRNPERSIILTSEFKKLGILKEGQSLSNGQITLLRHLIDVNRGLFIRLSPILQTNLVEAV